MKEEIRNYLRASFPVPLEDAELAEIVDAFGVSFRSAADELRAMPPSDFGGIRRVTHAIKGFASNVGVDALSSAAAALNASAHAEDSAACALGIRDIVAMYDAFAAEP